MLQHRMQLVRNRVQELIQRANNLYGITLPYVEVKFDLRGGCAGQAIATGNVYNRTYTMRFNADMMQNSSWDHLYNDTIPHELAHIICFTRGNNGGHGAEWKRICSALGGSATRCHNEEVVYARGRTYEYTTSTGNTMRISEMRHHKVQTGNYWLTSPNKGKIDHTCMFTIVN